MSFKGLTLVQEIGQNDVQLCRAACEKMRVMLEFVVKLKSTFERAAEAELIRRCFDIVLSSSVFESFLHILYCEDTFEASLIKVGLVHDGAARGDASAWHRCERNEVVRCDILLRVHS